MLHYFGNTLLHAQVTPTAPDNIGDSVGDSVDDDEDDVAHPKKKSRKDPNARSIRQVDNQHRAKAIEEGYNYIRLKVLTDEKVMWLESRAELAIFAEEAFAWGVKKLGYDCSDFDELTEGEQDLVCSQLR